MSPEEGLELAARLTAIRDRIAEAAKRSGRPLDAIRLVAVSKYQPVEAVRAALAAGQDVFGENYVQEALAKQAALADTTARWHCIGHVQTNKAKDVAGRFCLIHTVDSLAFARALDRRMPETTVPEEGVPPSCQGVLIQVNIGSESQKFGVAPDDLPLLAEEVAALPRLHLRGLMCLPPFFDDPEAARPFFARLRELRDALQIRLGLPLPELSMGMSGDFEAAVEEGATVVRVGTSLFGPRHA